MKRLKISPIYTFLIIALAVMLLYVYFVYLPLSQRTAELNAENNSMKTQIETIENDMENINKLEQDKTDVQNRIAEFDKRIGFDGNTLTVLADINAIAAASGVKTAGITTQKTSAVNANAIINKSYKTLKTNVDINFSGNFAAISKFLKAFEEKTDKFYRVDAVNITPVFHSNSNDYFTNSDYNGVLKLAVYYNDPTNKLQ